MTDLKKIKVEGLEKWGEEVIPMKLFNDNTLYYVERNGMYFEVGIKLKDSNEIESFDNVGDSMMRVLLNAYTYNFRIRIWHGDRNTGKSWNEEYDVTGTVGKSSGNLKIPLLMRTKRSHFGGALLLSSIIRIDDIEDKRTLWKLPNFHVEPMRVDYKEGSEYPYMVMQQKDGETNYHYNIANFKNKRSAENYIKFMNGERYCK